MTRAPKAFRIAGVKSEGEESPVARGREKASAGTCGERGPKRFPVAITHVAAAHDAGQATRKWGCPRERGPGAGCPHSSVAERAAGASDVSRGSCIPPGPRSVENLPESSTDGQELTVFLQQGSPPGTGP